MTSAEHHAPSTLPLSSTVILNVAHSLDHMFLLIFAAAISSIPMRRR